jgi:hypothetical protein
MGKPTFFALVLAITLSAVPMAIANQPADRGDTPGLGWGPGGRVVGAPGPVAGIGLPILAVAGGFIWIRSRKRRSDRLNG